ncbi:ferritin-like domain-containing protein [Herbiconiux sp. KACC 21604]|uniref:ferritin-like domain-containing protein n=1 Tax=unclassified Herbiconiux TaxID=2618217 RepID=UPI001490D8CE|nr:ferritin-like domain-containing protein [Herbiconiux sp. SALV-R1]QJU53226.1 ferritin-like domain-containing protein [Herbiconiux sp. SALV-R1]WPO88181.1 ferritin-like domain-containing protein [Herbiconiux sp. KACC 21604]
MAFDIDKYTETSTKVAWQDLDFSVFRDEPLPEGTLRSLRYMCDVEYHTVCYLRDMLVTPSHKDEDVTAFMTMWNREEFWHGEALAAVLAEHDVIVDFDELKATRLKLGWKDRLDPVKQSLLGNIVGSGFIAVHMIWGAANEWSAVAAYNRLAALEKHPVLAELLKRIAKQESRHVAFYATQARERLEKSKKAQVFARFALKNFWGPVGSTIMSDEEVKHVMGHIMGGPEGRKEAAKIDAHIAKMPGLSGLTIVQDSLDARGIAA